MPKSHVVNWTGNQRCLPEQVCVPRSTAELADIVAHAHARRSRVKTIGAGHSFTAAAMTDGVLIRLDQLAQVESFDITTGVVVVGAGMRLCELNTELADRGRALPNLGDIDVQTVAGATATATHGTGRHRQNLSSGIVGFELVTASGEVQWCDADNHPEIWRVGRVSIGALGVITKVALATVPAFNLRAVEGPASVDEVMSDWSQFVDSAEHAEFFWLPGSDRCFTKRNDVTTDPAQPRSKRRHLVDKILLENVAMDVAMRINRRFPSQRGRLADALVSALGPTEHVDVSHRVFASPRHVRFIEMEYGVPLDALPEAFARVRALVDAMDQPPLFPVEVRTSQGDDIPLSTASGRDSGWIAVHQYRGMPYGDYFRAVESVMNDYDGRPHWGKFHYQTARSLAPRYPEWSAFQEVRAKLDPSATFANDYTDRVLGPVGG